MSDGRSLREAFLGSLAPEVRATWSGVADLETTLQRAAQCARPPSPCPAPDPIAHVAALARRVGEGEADIAMIDALDHASIALAEACASGDPHAIAAFRATHLEDITRAIVRTRAPDPLLDDIRQIVLAKLLPPGGRIARFGGRGELRNWLRAVAVRETISVLRSSAGESMRDELPLELAGPADLERSAVRADAREHLASALRAAFDALDDEDRTVLRYRFTDGLTLDQLAVVLGVHRATAARWLARIRDDLARAMRRRLEQSGMARAEVDGLVAVSNLEVSLGGLLR